MTERPEWEDTWMDVCDVFSQRSTCWKRKVAAVLVDADNRIVSMGYNGTPAGESHCVRVGPRDPVEHRAWSKDNEFHAEENALLYLTKYPRIYLPQKSTLYTTLSPCLKCAHLIYGAGIGRIIVKEVRRPEGMDYLRARGVDVFVYSE
jgi:dCMP deaminase